MIKMLKRYNKYTHININNIEFNLKGVISSETIKDLKFDRLENCYNKPSDTKVSIYYSWYYTYLDNVNIIKFGVGSYNSSIFTINSIIDIDNKKYYLYITPRKNECYEVID